MMNQKERQYDKSNIKFKISIMRSNLPDHSDENMLVKGTITVPNTTGAVAVVNNTNKKVTFKNCAPFTICITEINNMQVDDAQDIDKVIPMYNLTLIWVGLLGVCFDVGVGVQCPSLCMKLVRITLVTPNLVRKCRHLFIFRIYTF